MSAGLLIMLREGFEAALVVAIVFAYLRKVGRLDLVLPVWAGVAAAVASSVAVGVVVHATIGDLEGSARLLAFAAVSFLALCVLTWMVFWMRRQSQKVRTDLEARVEGAVEARNTAFALALVAFLAVLREGVEAALFLVAAATEEGGSHLVLGAATGIVLAAVLAYGVYAGGRNLPLQTFFRVTGVVLIVFAAGLASKTVLYLQSAEEVGSFNLNGVFDLRGVSWLTTSTEVGRFLAAMVGWDPRPSIEQVVVWLAYAVPVTVLFLRPPRRRSEGTDTSSRPVGVASMP